MQIILIPVVAAFIALLIFVPVLLRRTQQAREHEEIVARLSQYETELREGLTYRR